MRRLGFGLGYLKDLNPRHSPLIKVFEGIGRYLGWEIPRFIDAFERLMTTLYPIINCVRCGQVFRQILRDLCPECIAVEDENAAKIARLLKASAPEGGLSLEDLSSQALIPADDVMALYEEGFSRRSALAPEKLS